MNPIYTGPATWQHLLKVNCHFGDSGSILKVKSEGKKEGLALDELQRTLGPKALPQPEELSLRVILSSGKVLFHFCQKPRKGEACTPYPSCSGRGQQKRNNMTKHSQVSLRHGGEGGESTQTGKSMVKPRADSWASFLGFSLWDSHSQRKCGVSSPELQVILCPLPHSRPSDSATAGQRTVDVQRSKKETPKDFLEPTNPRNP